MSQRDRFRGCLIGGAIGDALGYPVEFLRLSQIREKYGQDGLTDLIIDGRTGTAIISDDTQMSLFTASGLLWAEHSMECRGIGDHTCGVYPSYLRWLYTQDSVVRDPAVLEMQPFERDGAPRIMDEQALYCNRAPGNTCLAALECGQMGEMEDPINDSKGCGGVMRVAPIGLYLHATPNFAFETAAAAAAITHGHPSGYLSSGMLASIIARLVNGDALIDAYAKSLSFLREFPGYEETEAALALAVKLADCSTAPEQAIKALGEGWVGEEALAIALYCALREQDPRTALLLSVNHDGDSDSTGAICGNILGAQYGLSAFPAQWNDAVELKSFTLKMADALYAAAAGNR